MKNKNISWLILAIVLSISVLFIAKPTYASTPSPPTLVEIILSLIVYVGIRLIVVTVTIAFLLSLIFKRQNKPIRQILLAAGVISGFTFVLMLVAIIFISNNPRSTPVDLMKPPNSVIYDPNFDGPDETGPDTYCESNKDCWCKNFTGAQYIPGRVPSSCNIKTNRCARCFYPDTKKTTGVNP